MVVEEVFRTVQLPSLCLLQNVDINVDLLPNLDFPRCSGVVAGDDLAALRALIPRPVPPHDENRRRLYEQYVVGKDHRWDEEAGEPIFDDFLYHCQSGVSDLEVFGASYTILLVTPPRVRMTVDYLLGLLARADTRPTPLFLSRFWTDFMDRIAFWPDAEDAGKRWSSIVAAFTQRLNRIYGLTEADGEQVDEWLMK